MVLDSGIPYQGHPNSKMRLVCNGLFVATRHVGCKASWPIRPPRRSCYFPSAWSQVTIKSCSIMEHLVLKN